MQSSGLIAVLVLVFRFCLFFLVFFFVPRRNIALHEKAEDEQTEIPRQYLMKFTRLS